MNTTYALNDSSVFPRHSHSAKGQHRSESVPSECDSPCHDSFNGVSEGLRTSDQRVAQQVCKRFTHRLLSLANRRLEYHVKRKVDADDVVQSVYRSFFRRCLTGDFDIEDWNGLWSLLSRIAVRKCIRHSKRMHAGCRDISRETSIHGETDDAAPFELPDREPSPDEISAVRETLQLLLEDLPDTKRYIVELRLAGFTVAEVSDRVGRSERSVHRSLEQVRSRLRQLTRM